MPITPVRLKPGVLTQYTPVLNETGWSASQLIRFYLGLPQKLGGWTQISPTLGGTGRGMWAWADLTGIPYAAVGTEGRLQLLTGGALYDITPVRQVDDVTVNFSTVINTPTVTIIDSTPPPTLTVGDWVNILVPVSVGGLIIQGFYLVTGVVNSTTLTIIAASNATSTVNNGGAVPTFQTFNTSADITVVLANHGLVANTLWQVQVTITIGGITLAGGVFYVVKSITNANTFVITQATLASGNAGPTGENSGHAHIEYPLASGVATTFYELGYGAGPYGGGSYGGANGTSFILLRQWYLSNWGQDLIGNFNGSPIFVWDPTGGTFNNPALAINTSNFLGAVDPPTMVNESFVAMPEQIMVALGADQSGGDQDPNLVRWSDVSDFTDWTATAANQAGSFRLPTGSQIVGGLQAPQFAILWTDIDAWVMQYIQPPLVFGFQKIGAGCELINGRAAGVYNSSVFWMSPEQFFRFDGVSVQVLPCAVYDKVFQNLNRAQLGKVWCWVNSTFNELFFFYPSANATEVDSYVKYNVIENLWDFGTLPRTCGVDTSAMGSPISCDTTSALQQHEIGYDANGGVMTASITSGYFAIAEGQQFVRVDRLIPDFLLTGGNPPMNQVNITLNFIDWPTDTPTTVGPFTWSPSAGPPYIIVRARGRLMSLTISSNQLGVFWRLGGFRWRGAPAGQR